MYYTHNKSSKLGRSLSSFKKAGLSLAIVAAGSFATTLPGMVSAKGGVTGTATTPVVDTSACNSADYVVGYNATFPSGTIKAGVTPEFQITGASACAFQFNARFVSVTTAYTYNVATNQLELADLRGYPVTEVSKDVVIKPGAFSIKNRIADKPVSGVYQMRTEVRMYMSTSFDANGNLLPDAVLLGTDVANWTQTNFVTV